MRILHVPYSFYPDPPGGTEVYVNTLATAQSAMGCHAAVAAPGATDSSYEHQGMRVWRFAVSTDLSLVALYGDGDQQAAKGFGRILDDFGPDVVHMHAFTSAVSILLAKQAAQRSIPIVFNYHTPTVSCMRGTLLKWGSEICDGNLHSAPCVACTVNAHGISPQLAKLISMLPETGSHLLGRAGLSGGIWTALRMPALIDLRIRSFRQLMQMVDRVVSLCDWTRALLVQNGVPENKISLCRQGISWSRDKPGGDPVSTELRLPLRAAFLGRLDRTKGAHVVVQALKSDPALPVTLDLFGVSQGEAGNQYAAGIRKLIADDTRIRMLAPLPSDRVVSRLCEYDLLVVPSQWLETGPLVVLEAFAAGIPVVGSNLGGIAELIRDAVDGLLVTPFDSPIAWAESLRRLCREPGLLFSLRGGIRRPRDMQQVAEEMMSLYESLAARRYPAVSA
jgi:glycosyltransferase involved in cell wall biosynthesis